MKSKERIFAILATATTLLLVVESSLLIKARSERERVEENFRQVELLSRMLADSLEASRASVVRLRLTIGELEECRALDAERIRTLGLRLRRVESVTKVASRLEVDTLLGAADSLVAPILSDSLYRLVWNDGWVSLNITSRPSLSRVSITSRDTLFQVVHRVPHRWWLFSWGTKAIRQEIHSSNPHTRLVYAEYIEIED
jgi:hypothetical protein